MFNADRINNLNVTDIFPDEILQYIFQFFEEADLYNINQVCKRFYNLVNDESFKKQYRSRIFKKNFSETIHQQAIRLYRKAHKAVATAEKIDAEIAQKDIDKYIDILVEQFKKEDEPRGGNFGVSKTRNYYIEVKKTSTEAISAKTIIKKTPGFSTPTCLALVFGMMSLSSGGFLVLSKTRKNEYNQTGIDIAFSISVFLFCIALFAAIINRCYVKKFKNSQVNIKALDERSPLLTIENSLFFKARKIENNEVDEENQEPTLSLK